jgi:hypothetical protein
MSYWEAEHDDTIVMNWYDHNLAVERQQQAMIDHKYEQDMIEYYEYRSSSDIDTYIKDKESLNDKRKNRR